MVRLMIGCWLRVIGTALCNCLILTGSLSAAVQTPEQLSAPGVSPPIWGVVEVPRGEGSYPGVIVLHGASGWQPMYADVARELADSGFVALALDYYAETGGAEIGSDEKPRKWPQWQATVRSAVDYLSALPTVSGNPVGLVGYSRGAFLAVSVASSTSSVQAVVDFFGGGGGGTDSLEQEARALPALLILHGEADEVVPVRFAENLRNAVIAHGGEVEMHLYSDAGHAFNMPHASTYVESISTDAFRRTVAFLVCPA